MRVGRVSLAAVLFVAAVAALAFGAGSLAGASSSDQAGTPVAITAHRIPSATAKPVTWDDSKPTYLPGTTTSVVLMQRSFLIIRPAGESGIECSDVDFQFVGSSAAVNLGSPHPVPVLAGGITPVLARGTYTVGLASSCQPPDDQNNPGATFQTNGGVEIDQVAVAH